MAKSLLLSTAIAALLLAGPAAAAPGDQAPEKKPACAPTAQGPAAECRASSVAQLRRMIGTGSVVALLHGTYRECLKLGMDNVTIEAAGALLQETICDGKAALVVTGQNIVIRNLACEGMTSADKNGACVRLQGGSLTLDGVRFANSENGFLGGRGDLTIVNSLFQGNGKAGFAHQVYFNSPHRLTVRNSRFIGAKDQGHGIKTGARETILDGVTIDGTGGRMSRNIDAFNGGILRITNSTLIKAASDVNRTIIGYDYEARVNLPDNAIVIENTTIDCGTGATILGGLNSLSTAEIVFRNNTVRGNCLDIARFRR